MGNKKKKTMTDVVKNITKESIYKIMNTITLAVSGIFLVKNVLSGAIAGSIAIGLCLAIYCMVLFVMKKINVPTDTRNLVVSVALLVVISIVSIFSGSSFSDDFLLYLAAMCMSGLFLRPQNPQIQISCQKVKIPLKAIILQRPMPRQQMGHNYQVILLFMWSSR